MSLFEKSILSQPALIRQVLTSPKPKWMVPPRGKKILLVGLGSNYHAAGIAAWLWSNTGLDVRAINSHDFVQKPTQISRNDVGIFLSHRGGISYTVKAESLAQKSGAKTFIMTAKNVKWATKALRIETGPLENNGAFTQSLTTTLAWLMRWPNVKSLLKPFDQLENELYWGPPTPKITKNSDVVILGDGPREFIAREISLKLQETAAISSRAFGLEEFLHGPMLSLGKKSIVIGISSPVQSRWSTLQKVLQEIDIRHINVCSNNWLSQIFWGQRLALNCCHELGINPDNLRDDYPKYKNAKNIISSDPV